MSLTKEYLASDEYTCGMCGETFTKSWSDDDAMDEHEAMFPDHKGPVAVICDDCFHKLFPVH